MLYENREIHFFAKKQMIFIKTLQKILKQSLIFQIMNGTDYYLKKENKKVIGLLKDELGGKS